MGAWVGGLARSRHMVMSGRTVWHIPDRLNRVMNPHASNPAMAPDLAMQTIPAVFNRAVGDTRTCKRGNSYDKANALFGSVTMRPGRGTARAKCRHAEQVLNYLSGRESKRTRPRS